MTVDEKLKRDADMITRGQMPEILIRDAHEDLAIGMNTMFPNIEEFPEETQQMLEDYVKKHLAYLQSQKEVAMMKQMQQQAMLPQPQMNTQNSEQMGLPQEQQGYNLGQIA
jgi:glutamate synthase domain-containing protein 3